MNAESLLHAALLGYVLAGLGGLVLARQERLANVVSFGLGAISAAVAAVAFAGFLTGGGVPGSVRLLPPLIPYLSFSITIDPLGGFFGLLVSVLGVALSIYSLGYARGFFGRKSVGLLGAFYNLILLATTLVFIADNAFFFLIAWEIMALAAFCLVSFEHEHADARAGAVLYFVMSHIGTGFILLGFLLLFQASARMLGDTGPAACSFEAFRAVGRQMGDGTRSAVFLLFLTGFGIKAGIIPLHTWLPVAHPVAPSNVSAFMSGVLIKTGIYGIVRMSFDFLGDPPLWWGVTLLALGTVSAILGVLYALMQHDLKRLLAYHSIENIGIILVGLGAALMFQHLGHPQLAALALIAGLYHTMNHALFKGLLFLGAGGVLQATHTRDMEKLGGLAKRMPGTAVCFLVGAIAISALPPLNGFVSEWLTFQSLLQGYGATPGIVRLMYPLCAAILAMTGALAAACFVKAFGVTFLAQPRSEAAAQARESSSPMILAQMLLTAACVVLGLCPSLMLGLLAPLTGQLLGQDISAALVGSDGLILHVPSPDAGAISTAGIVVAGVFLLIVPLLCWLWFSRRAPVRVGPTWDCGLQGLTPRMEYTATGFSKPIRMIFKALFRPHREVQREYDYSPYFAKTIRFNAHVEEIFETRIYRPLHRFILRLSRRMRALQTGSLQAYLIYIFITLLALLLYLVLFPPPA